MIGDALVEFLISFHYFEPYGASNIPRTHIVRAVRRPVEILMYPSYGRKFV